MTKPIFPADVSAVAALEVRVVALESQIDRLSEALEDANQSARPADVHIQSEIWQHVKSGGLYTVIGHGLIEADLTPATIYRSLWDGAVWVRPTAEFEDGRFLNLSVDEVADCRPAADKS